MTFEMKAVQAGSATVRLGFSFEIAVEICGPVTVIYQFVQGSGIVEVTVAPSDTPSAAPNDPGLGAVWAMMIPSSERRDIVSVTIESASGVRRPGSKRRDDTSVHTA